MISPVWGLGNPLLHCSSLLTVTVNQKDKGAKQTSRPGSVNTCNYLSSMYIIWFTIPTTECGCIIKLSKSLSAIVILFMIQEWNILCMCQATWNTYSRICNIWSLTALKLLVVTFPTFTDRFNNVIHQDKILSQSSSVPLFL